jgi:hypothetical protein
LITEDEAARHEFRNVVTQVLGNKPEINVNLSRTLTLQSGDAVLLCSDGLYGALPDNLLISLTIENEPKRAAKLLVEAAIDAEATDNITAVVLRMGEAKAAADEPTLAPLPAATTAAATTTSSAAMDSAPTIMTQAPTLPPAAAAKDKGGISKWLVILAIAAVFLIIAALVAFWLRNRSVTEDSLDAAATALPAIVETPAATSAGALRAIVPTSTIESLVITEEPQSTATIPPPATPTLEPTPTIQVAEENRGCVKDGVVAFVWEENQVRAGNCDLAFVQIEAGREIRILDDPALTGAGACNNAQFVKVQSVDEITKLGWVDETLINRLGPGENCGS